jgi:branched-chain amino acid transport system permease protein
VINVFLSGLTTGAIYAALVLGVVLVYRFAHAVNFAHGAVATLAAYCAYQALSSDVPYWVAALLAIAVGTAVNSIIGWILTRFFLGADEIVQTMASMGPMLAIVGLVGVLWGQQAKSLELPGIPTTAVRFGDYLVSAVGLVVLGLIAVIILLLIAVVRWTRYGVLLRALSDSRAVAAMYGLRVVALERAIWAIGGALATAAGLLIVPQVSLLPQTLTDLLIIGLAAATLGGMASLAGLITGGFIFGVTVAFTQYFFQLQMNSILALLVAVLVFAFRPEGLFGRASRRPVEFFPQMIESAAGGVRRAPRRTGPSRYPARLAGAVAAGARSVDGQAWFAALRRHSLLGTVAVLAVLVLLAPYLFSTQLIFTLTTVALMSIAIAGQNVLSGLSGMLFLAQGGLMAVGSYASAIMSVRYGLSMVEAIPLGVLAGLLVAVALRAAVFRIGGFYLGMVTLLFSLAVPEVVLAFDSVTGGSAGLFTSGFVLGDGGIVGVETTFWICSGLAIVALTLVTLFKRSHVGLTIRAIRDSRRGAESIGVGPQRPRLVAVAVAGACAGLAGAVSAFQVGVVTPEAFGVLTSIHVLLAAAIGGTESTFVGPLLGALFIVGLPYALGGSGSVSQIAFGVVLIAALAVKVAIAKRARAGSAAADTAGEDGAAVPEGVPRPTRGRPDAGILLGS